MKLLPWLVFVLAAVLEVGGDAAMRRGLHGKSAFFGVLGGLALAAYGLVVNTVPWNFSKLLGVYVAVFAVVSVLAGRILFKEAIPPGTWAGLALIVAGGLVIQFWRGGAA
jgi:drug/metabolite transporter superfamily protein YnfA